MGRAISVLEETFPLPSWQRVRERGLTHSLPSLPSRVRLHCATHPPSTLRVVPVIDAAPSLHRKTAVAAISSTFTNCLLGWRSRTIFGMTSSRDRPLTLA